VTLHVGVAVRRVMVPNGTPMAGFAARLSGSSGVHDATTVRAMVVDDTALVTVDVCVLHEDTCAAIASRSGLGGVVVSATHTHGGPSIGCGRAGDHSPETHDSVVEAAVEAIAEAADAQRPVFTEWASTRGLGVAKDRRHPGRHIDPPLSGLRFRARSGDVVVTLVSYPCHPVVLDATNTLITSDYVHPLRVAVEEATGAPCVFLTGTAGDVNTGHLATDSFGAGVAAHRSFDRANEAGRALGDGLLTSDWTRIDAVTGILRQRDVALRFERITQHEVDAKRAEWEAQLPGSDPGPSELLRRWIDWANAWQPTSSATAWTGRVSVLDMGCAMIVTLPGEPFLWASESLSRAGSHVIVAGYSDGVPGYLPTSAAYTEGGYEVEDAHRYYGMPAPFRRGSLEYVVDTARALMHE